MNTQTHYTIIGFFVLSLTASIVLGIIWLSSGFSFEDYTFYQINMQESVSGLSIDSSVEYNGVNVGNVKSIELNPNDPQLVEILINVKKNTPITHGTVATLATRGLTGLVYIALKDNSTDLRQLKKEYGYKYPIIRTSPSIFVRINDAFTQLNNNLQELSYSVRQVLNRENQANIQSSLRAMKQISQQLIPLVKTSQETLDQLQLQLMPATYELITHLNATNDQFSQLTAQVKDNPSILLRGTTQAPLGPGEKK